MHWVSKRTDHVILFISYNFQFIDLPVYKSRSRSGDIITKGHHLSDNLRTTLTHPHPNAIDRCPFEGLCNSKNNLRWAQILFPKFKVYSSLLVKGGGSGLSLWKNDFELGVGGKCLDTSRHFESGFGSMHITNNTAHARHQSKKWGQKTKSVLKK